MHPPLYDMALVCDPELAKAKAKAGQDHHVDATLLTDQVLILIFSQSHLPAIAFGLAGLPVVPSLGLVWPGPVLPALPALPWPGPATTTATAKPPPAAEGGRLLLLDQALQEAKARQARQAQARPSEGKVQQASQPSQSRILGPKAQGGPRGLMVGFLGRVSPKGAWQK